MRRRPDTAAAGPTRRGVIALALAAGATAASRECGAGSARAAGRVDSLPLEVGILPNISARLLLTQYGTLRQHLEQRLGRTVQLSTASDWRSYYRRAQALEHDVMIAAANVARLAEVDLGYTPLAQFMPLIKGLIVSAADRPLVRVIALRGQRLALANPASLVALQGRRWLAERGLRAEHDYTAMPVPNDDSVANLVLGGDCVAAMLSAGEFRAIPETLRSQLVVDVEFAQVPGFVVCISPSLGPAAVRQLRSALHAFTAESELGRQFFAATGLTHLVELAPGALQPLDSFVEPTRQLLAPR